MFFLVNVWLSYELWQLQYVLHRPAPSLSCYTYNVPNMPPYIWPARKQRNMIVKQIAY